MIGRNPCSIRIFFQKTLIFICKSITASIVRGININHIDFPMMRVVQASQGMVIISLDEYMGRLAIIVFDGKFGDFFKDWDFVFTLCIERLGHIHPMQPELIVLFQLLVQVCNLFLQFRNPAVQFIYVFFHSFWICSIRPNPTMKDHQETEKV